MSTATPNPDDGIPPVPRKLTDEFIAAAVALLLQGNFRFVVASSLGIDPTTFSRWMSLGRQYPDGIYGRLCQSVQAAESAWEVRAVAGVQAAGSADASHLEWLLERKYPQRWGRYRGELGKLKRELAERDKRIEALEKLIADLESAALGTAGPDSE